ncbi:membrane protein, putative [Babesia bigemina]|uniref:Membrane protein, putative n=1 Tax=Babesia bigemina TaxID=5866 RepID=A0A061D4U8_BABBI|nr:membrane protein, putative [Babesia bigemina]CDR95593.1 membrane protein, putative [Babesia bigemina]|eukprot:XP_012767779.1 membrane protein, putative [Babesia bigemina]
MKTGVCSGVLALWLLSVADVYAIEESAGSGALAMQNEESTPYSYFLESELDNTYERGDDSSLYEIPDDDALTTMSLLDLAGAPDLLESADGEFSDESDFSFLEERDEEDEFNGESFLEADDDDMFDFDASFMEAEEDENPADELSSGIDEELEDAEATNTEFLDSEPTSYVPIRHRMTAKKCNNHLNNNVQPAVEGVQDAKAAMLQQDEVAETSSSGSFFKRNRAVIIVGVVLLISAAIGICTFKYPPPCVAAAKERIRGYFNRENDRNSVLPEVTETEPLVAQ